MDWNQKNNSRRSQAKKRGIEYTLMPLTLRKIYHQQRCFYLNVPLNVKYERFAKPTKLTLDRVNSLKGYTKENVVACSSFANQLKNMIESGLITPDDVIECGKRFRDLMNK